MDFLILAIFVGGFAGLIWYGYSGRARGAQIGEWVAQTFGISQGTVNHRQHIRNAGEVADVTSDPSSGLALIHSHDPAFAEPSLQFLVVQSLTALAKAWNEGTPGYARPVLDDGTYSQLVRRCSMPAQARRPLTAVNQLAIIAAGCGNGTETTTWRTALASTDGMRAADVTIERGCPAAGASSTAPRGQCLTCGTPLHSVPADGLCPSCGTALGPPPGSWVITRLAGVAGGLDVSGRVQTEPLRPFGANSRNADVQAAAALIAASAVTEGVLRRIAATDPEFRPDALIGYVEKLYVNSIPARRSGDPGLFPVPVPPAIAVHFMQSQPRMDGNSPTRAFISDADADDRAQYVTVALELGRRIEYWGLSRPTGTKTRPDGGLLAYRCPNCGGALDLDPEERCRYCGATPVSGGSDWTITKIVR